MEIGSTQICADKEKFANISVEICVSEGSAGHSSYLHQIDLLIALCRAVSRIHDLHDLISPLRTGYGRLGS